MKTTVVKNKDATARVEGEIPAEEFERFRERATKALGAELALPGFRKGKAPVKLVAERVGERAVLEEAARRAIAEVLPNVLAEHALEPLGAPNITITKLAAGNPLEFRAEFAILPAITLPDHRALAREKNAEPRENLAVSDEEVRRASDDIVSRVRLLQEAGQAKRESGEDPAPFELTDESVKTLGDYTNLADFKEKLRADILRHKERAAKDARRAHLLDALLAKTDIVVPKMLVDAEIERMLAIFKGQLAQSGVEASFETYLAEIKKTEAHLRDEWRPEAEKRAKTQLLLNALAVAEHIRADEKAVAAEVAHLVSHHPKATREEKDRAHIYIETILTNEQVLEFLESVK